MTFSIRPRYSTNNEIHKLKDFDTHCEPDLISILFLSQWKPKLTRVCIDSALKSISLYPGEREHIFLVNGINHEEGWANFLYFKDLDVERKVIISNDLNYGIGVGLNNLFSISRGEFVLLLEADWYAVNQTWDFLSVSMEIFHEQPDLQILHLRDYADQFENWGLYQKDFNPWSILEECGKSVFKHFTSSGHPYLLSRYKYCYSNNPCIIRKSFWRSIGLFDESINNADARHGETQYQLRVHALNPLVGHIVRPLFIHGGGTRRFSIEAMYNE